MLQEIYKINTSFDVTVVNFNCLESRHYLYSFIFIAKIKKKNLKKNVLTFGLIIFMISNLTCVNNSYGSKKITHRNIIHIIIRKTIACAYNYEFNNNNNNKY